MTTSSWSRGVNEIEAVRRPIKVIELDVNTAVSQPVDIVLFDTFGCYDGMAGVAERGQALLPGRVVLYAWELNPAPRRWPVRPRWMARSQRVGRGRAGQALEAVHSGEGFVFRDNNPGDADDEQANGNLRHPTTGQDGRPGCRCARPR